MVLRVCYLCRVALVNTVSASISPILMVHQHFGPCLCTATLEPGKKAVEPDQILKAFSTPQNPPKPRKK
eukprot:5986316-Amphidinium_carterae.1